MPEARNDDGHVPSTSFAGEGAAARMARSEAWRRLRLHARRMAGACAGVTLVAALFSLYLAEVGTRTCTRTPDGERCVSTSWYPLTFQPRLRTESLDGVPDGQRIEWYNNGEVWFVGRYSRGVKTGEWREYYPSGRTRFEGRYQGGSLEGVETWWYPSGDIEWQVTRQKGKRHGPEIWRHTNGSPRRQGRYVDGEKHGVFTVYRPDGSVQLQMRYARGLRLDDGAADES